MSKVGIVYKVYPKEGEMDNARENIKKEYAPASIESEDVAFGIKVLKVFFKFDDSDPNMQDMEDKLKKIDGVSEVEVSEESLL